MHCSRRSCELPDRGLLGTEAFAAIAETAWRRAGGHDPRSTRSMTQRSTPIPDPALYDRGVVLLRGAWAGASRPGMKHVLLLATTTGYQIRSFGEAAEKLGVRLMFASDRCDQLEDPWSDQAIPVRFLGRGRLGRRRVAAAPTRVQTASSRSAIGRRFWPRVSPRRSVLPGNPPPAVRASRNKLASRRAFKAAGLLDAVVYRRLDCRRSVGAGGGLHLPGGRQAARAVRKSRRDARGSGQRLRLGVRTSAAGCWGRPTS